MNIELYMWPGVWLRVIHRTTKLCSFLQASILNGANGGDTHVHSVVKCFTGAFSSDATHIQRDKSKNPI